MTNQLPPHPILALDIATNTGWAVSLDGVSMSNSGHQNFSVKKDESTGMRLFRFNNWLKEQYSKYNFKIIVIENTVQQRGFGGKRAGAHVQAEMQGIVKLFCEENKIDYKGFYPTSIKAHAVGGRAKKEEMIRAAQKKWKRVFESDDEADACWLLDYVLSGALNA